MGHTALAVIIIRLTVSPFQGSVPLSADTTSMCTLVPLSLALCQMTSAGGLGRSAFLTLRIGMTHMADFERPSPFA